MLTAQAAIAANRFGLGARPGDAAAIGADPAGWLREQLAAERRAAPPAAAPPESSGVLRALRGLRAARQAAAPDRASAGRPPPASADGGVEGSAAQTSRGNAEAALRELGRFSREHYRAQAAERHRRAIETERPFVERIVQFWTNHFAVSADKRLIGPLAGLYEQEAIRPNALGNFRELLLAAERHPAMNLYLDNTASMGASSVAARFARRRGRELGLNENLAREILELHTLGVDGGYDQHDVTELAKVITGWSIDGEFRFRPLMHEPGDKTVLGKRVQEGGVEEGEQVLAMLARHPSTARHLATKLARHFVADDPPPRLVERLAAAYTSSGGELVPVYEALLAADESWREPLAKYKTPQDFVISAFRALGRAPDNLEALTAFLAELGQRPFTPGSPAGWPDTAASWNGGDALLKRIEWGAAVSKRAGTAPRLEAAELAGAVLGPVSDATLASLRGAADRAQGLALLLAAPEFQRR